MQRALLVVVMVAGCASTPYENLGRRPAYYEDVDQLSQAAREAAAATGYDVVAVSADARTSLALRRDVSGPIVDGVAIRIVPGFGRASSKLLVTPVAMAGGHLLPHDRVSYEAEVGALQIESGVCQRLCHGRDFRHAGTGLHNTKR